MNVVSGWTGAAEPNLRFRAVASVNRGRRGAQLQQIQIPAGLSAKGLTARVSLRGPPEA